MLAIILGKYNDIRIMARTKRNDSLKRCCAVQLHVLWGSMLLTHLMPREINDEPVCACISLATLCDNASGLGEQESIAMYSRTSLCHPRENF